MAYWVIEGSNFSPSVLTKQISLNNHSAIHSFTNYLLSNLLYVGTILFAWDIAVNERRQ